MHKVLSVLSLFGFILSIKADATYPPTSQTSQVGSDSPQTFVPAASYQNNDAISVLNNPANFDPTLYQTYAVPQDVVQQYANQYGVQAGGYSGQVLEGFLLPTLKQTETLSPTFLSLVKTLLPGPKLILAILAKIVALTASAIGIVAFGGVMTSFVCAFTPLCTITFFGRPLALLRQETKELVEKIGSEVTTDRIKRAADLFKLALDKYSAMQNS